MIAVSDPSTEFCTRRELKSILFVTNDADDFGVAREEIHKLSLANPIRRVASAEELFYYISGDGPYRNRANHPLPLVIVLDLILPDSGCLKAQALIRSHVVTRRLPLIMTGSAEQLDSHRSLISVGVDGYVPKPFSRLDFGSILLEKKIPLSLVDAGSARW